MFSYEGSGKTVEKAIEDALFNLRASRDDVDIKVLDTGGLFRKAKVLVEISDDCKEKYKKRREDRKRLLQEDEEEKKDSQETDCHCNDQCDCKESECEDDCNCVEECTCEECECVEECTCQEDQQCDCKECECESAPSAKQTESELGKNFLQGFLKSVNVEGEVLVEETADEIFYTIKGNDVASLIGYRGECLNSLQFLTSVINGKANRKSKKVRLDIDGYREKRKNTLTALAHRMCKKVQKTGHSTKLEPMSAYERRIIHTIVSENYPDLESVSKGEEPHRYLIIKNK